MLQGLLVGIDYLAVARRALRPDRPRLAEARAAVSGISDPRSAWEALAASGLMPGIASSDPQRTFIEAEKKPASYPPTIEACVTLAGDPTSVLAVEAHARECVARLPPWGAKAAPPIRWRVGRLTAHDLIRSPPQEPTGLLHLLLLDAHDTGEHDGEAAWVMHAGVPRRPWPTARDCPDAVALGRLIREISAHELWQSAALSGYRLTGADRSVAEMADPFAPSFEIWRLGYAVDAISEDVIVLVARPTGLRERLRAVFGWR